MNNFSIAVFGCWNKGCKNNSGQKSVSNLIKLNESKYQFMVILGDNYYAEKKNLYESGDSKLKIKLTNIQELKEGFECIQDINLEKKLIMGNHDIEDSFDKSCSVIKTQLKLPWFDIKFPYGYDMYYLYGDEDNSNNQTILFIYLDTTLYSEGINNNNSCYHLVLDKSFDELKTEQNNFIIQTLEITQNQLLNISKVVFFGHEPLFTFKEKNGKNKSAIITELLDLLFYQMDPNIKYYWICADYHIYQNSTITSKSEPDKKIYQWIFGTGGGDLDNSVSTNYIESSNYNLLIQPNIVLDSNFNDISNCFDGVFGVKKFGYGEISFNSNSVTHKFVIADYHDDNPETKPKKKKEKITVNGGGNNYYKDKYIKYKTKYNELKNKNI
jgi:hypothetical protein